MQDQDDRLKIENVQSLYPDDLSDDWNTGIDVCKKNSHIYRFAYIVFKTFFCGIDSKIFP